MSNYLKEFIGHPDNWDKNVDIGLNISRLTSSLSGDLTPVGFQSVKFFPGQDKLLSGVAMRAWKHSPSKAV